MRSTGSPPPPPHVARRLRNSCACLTVGPCHRRRPPKSPRPVRELWASFGAAPLLWRRQWAQEPTLGRPEDLPENSRGRSSHGRADAISPAGAQVNGLRLDGARILAVQNSPSSSPPGSRSISTLLPIRLPPPPRWESARGRLLRRKSRVVSGRSRGRGRVGGEGRGRLRTEDGGWRIERPSAEANCATTKRRTVGR